MANPRNRSAERQSWKKRKSGAEQRSPKSQRWLLTILAIGLMVLLGYILFPKPAIQVQFVSLEVNDYAKLVVPPLASDSQALRDSDDGTLQFLKYTDLSEALDESLGDLPRMAAICGPKDRLVVYLCAHLVPSDDGGVDILLRNFDVRPGNSETSRARYPLEKVLQLMKSSAAEVKLLLIDSGRLTIDSRLSLMGNQAYALLEKQLEETNDSGLGAIVSNRPLESSCGWYGRPQLFFGQAVNEAFAGAADEDGDSWLTVGEVYRYVAQLCYFHSGEAQLPVLLTSDASTGSFMDHRLFALEASDVPADEEAETEGEEATEEKSESKEESTEKSAEKTDGASNAEAASTPSESGADSSTEPQDSDAADPAASGDKKETEAQDTTSGDESNGDVNATNPVQGDTPSETSSYLRLVDQAWALRDKLVAEQSALEAVPHLCRELDARILDFELRYHGSSPDEFTVNLLTELVDSLQVVAKRRTPVRGNLGNRLAIGLKSYSQSTEDAAIRAVQRYAYRARDFVDWHAKIAFLMADGEQNEFARRLKQLLEDINEFRSSVNEAAASEVLTEAREKTLRDMADNIKKQDIAVQNEWSRLLQVASEAVRKPRKQCLIEATLGSRVPNAEMRRYLRGLLLDSRSWDPDARARLPSTGGNASPVKISANLTRHVQLEQLLLPPGLTIESRLDRWEDLRAAAKAIGNYYASLPIAVDARDGADTAWQLAAVDCRDVSHVDLVSTVELPDYYLPRPIFRLDLEPAKSLQLSAPGTRLRWRFENTTGEQISAEINYDSRIVLVYDSDKPDANLIKSGAALMLPSSQDSLELVARPTNPKRSKPIDDELTCNFRSGGMKLNRTVTLNQLVDDVELVVYHLTAVGAPPQPREQSLVTLKPFPNRDSKFRLELRNPTDKAKTVTAKIALVPATEVSPGRLADDRYQILADVLNRVVEQGRLSDTAKIVAETTAPIVIPANGDAPFALGPPGAGKGSSEDADEVAAPEKKPTGSPAGVTDVSYGVVCQIEEQSADGSVITRWLKWLEIRPLEPSEYMSCNPAYVDGRFTATLVPKSDRLPEMASLGAKPIAVRWDTSPFTERPRKLSGTGSIVEANGKVTVRGEFQPPASVWLDVDGYPRAFVFEAKVGGRLERGPVEPAARILSLSHSKFAKIFVRRGMIEENQPTLGDQQGYVFFTSDDLIAFRKEKGPITLRFQVDARPSSFGPDDLKQANRDSVQVDLGADFKFPTYYDDRQLATTLSAIENDTLTLNCQVSDYELQITDIDISDPEPLQVTVVDGELRSFDEVELMLDATEPELLVNVPTSVVTGQSFKVEVNVTDASGIDRVATGFVDRKDAPLAKAKIEDNVPDDGVLAFTLKAPGEAREYLVKVEATNGALLTKDKVLTLRVRAPATPAPPKYTVKGNARIGVRLRGGIKVTLKGKTKVTKDNGDFEFVNVEPGDATLTAVGTWQGKEYSAEKAVKLPEKGADAQIDLKEFRLLPAK